MKKLFAALTAIIAVIAIFPAVVFAEDVICSADGVNTGRGENQLIVYNPLFGDTTMTNEWGAEAAVGSDGRVIRISTAGNESIPEGGFVLSGHGTAKAWLTENVSVGDYVYFNSVSGIVTVSDEPRADAGMEYSLTHALNGVNIYRSTDFMVVYTGQAATGTNEWGYEVTVSGGRITSVGGNNIAIPSGGYVISGHGESADWLRNNAAVGMKAEYSASDGTVTLTCDAEAYVIGFDKEISDIEARISAARAEYDYCDYDYIDSCVKELKKQRSAFLSAATPSDKYKCINAIEEYLAKASAACSVSRPVEYRGAWLRPMQTTRAEVADYVQRLYEAGINTICIETQFGSTLICPAPEGSDWEQNPYFGGFDVLGAYIEECHARGMELHIWMPVFYCGHTGASNLTASPWYKNPSWQSVNNSGSTVSVNSDSTFCFLNPASEEVQDFLLDTYRWLLTEYDIDGFELDYIRYQYRDGDDYGYDDITVSGFRSKYGITPVYDPSASWWEDWVQYRCDIITGFVGRVRALFDEVSPGTLLCADVGGAISSAREYIYQDYSVWLEKGWIDLLKPMSYSTDSVALTYEKVAAAKGKYVAAGLGVFEGVYDAADMVEHCVTAVGQGADGVMFFEASTYLAKDCASMFLGEGPFRNRAVTPTFNASAAAKAMLEYTAEHITDCIYPLGGVTASSRDALLNTINGISDLVTAGEIGAAYDAAASAVSGLSSSAGEEAVRKDLEYLLRILSRAEAGSGGSGENPPDGPSDIPDDSSAGNTEVSDGNISAEVSGNESGVPSVSGGSVDNSVAPDSGDRSDAAESGDGHGGLTAGQTALVIVFALAAAAAAAAVPLIFLRRRRG